MLCRCLLQEVAMEDLSSERYIAINGHEISGFFDVEIILGISEITGHYLCNVDSLDI